MKRAYTLAEVLITLGIIGVVSALTIPTLIQNYQKQATATSLKKAYSELNQVLQMSIADNGDPATWNYNSSEELPNWIKTYIEPYVKVIEAGGDCQLSKKTCHGMPPIKALQSKASASYPHYYVVKGGNAPAWAFYRYGGGYASTVRVRVYLRKPKGQAYIGKDVFTFTFAPSQDKAFKPYGLGKANRDALLTPRGIGNGSCNKSTGGGDYFGPGDACSTVIMLDGWKISKDYPWSN